MLKIAGQYLTVFESKFKKGRWGFGIGGNFSKKTFPGQDAAKMALFEEFWKLTDGRLGR
jgi:hypothetical protein